jgi:hypothetical protein
VVAFKFNTVHLGRFLLLGCGRETNNKTFVQTIRFKSTLVIAMDSDNFWDADPIAPGDVSDTHRLRLQQNASLPSGTDSPGAPSSCNRRVRNRDWSPSDYGFSSPDTSFDSMNSEQHVKALADLRTQVDRQLKVHQLLEKARRVPPPTPEPMVDDPSQVHTICGKEEEIYLYRAGESVWLDIDMVREPVFKSAELNRPVDCPLCETNKKKNIKNNIKFKNNCLVHVLWTDKTKKDYSGKHYRMYIVDQDVIVPSNCLFFCDLDFVLLPDDTLRPVIPETQGVKTGGTAPTAVMHQKKDRVVPRSKLRLSASNEESRRNENNRKYTNAKKDNFYSKFDWVNRDHLERRGGRSNWQPEVLSFDISSSSVDRLNEMLGSEDGIKVSHTVDPIAMEQFTQFVEAINNATSKLPSSSELGDLMKDGVEAFRENCLDMAIMVGAAVGLHRWYTLGDGKFIAVAGAILCARNHKLFSNLWQWAVENVFNKVGEKYSNRFHPQVGDDDLTFASALGSLVFGFISCKSTGSQIGLPKFKDFLRTLGDFKKLRGGTDELVKTVFFLCEKSANYVREHVLGLPPMHFYTTNAPDVMRWCSEVSKMCEEIHFGKVTINRSNGERLYRLYMKGNELTTKWYSQKDAGTVRSALSSHMTMLRKALIPFDQSGLVGAGPRMEPVAILLTGATGVGKSYATYPLATQIISKVLPPEEVQNFKDNFMEYIYVRQNEHKFWDGYKGQLCTFMDDFGQARDAAGNPENEFMDIIRMCNMFPHICHMAGMESKGNTIFMSKLIICSTNLHSIDRSNVFSMNSPEAVDRRFDVKVVVAPKPEYRKDPHVKVDDFIRLRLDGSKLDGSGKFQKEIYEFHVEGIPGAMDFDGLVEHIVSLYKKRQHSSDAYLDSVRSMMTSFEPQVRLPNFITNLLPQFGESEDGSDEEEEILHMAPISGIEPIKTAYAYVPGEHGLPPMSSGVGVQSRAAQAFTEFLGNKIDWDQSGYLLSKSQFSEMSLEDIFSLREEDSGPTNFDVVDDPIVLWLNKLTLPIWVEELVATYKPKILENVPNSHVLFYMATHMTKSFDELRLQPRRRVAQYIKRVLGMRSVCLEIQMWHSVITNMRWDREAHQLHIKRNLLRKLFDTICEENEKFGRRYPFLAFIARAVMYNGLIAMVIGITKHLFHTLFPTKKSSEEEVLRDEDCEFDTFISNPEAEAASGVVGRKTGHGRSRGDKARAAKRTSKLTLAHRSFFAEGGVDVNADETISKVVKNNFYELYCPTKEYKYGNVLAIRDQVYMIPNHYKAFFKQCMDKGSIDDDEPLELLDYKGEPVVALTVREILQAPNIPQLSDVDLAYFTLPKNTRRHKDITKCFVSQEVLDNKRNMYCRLTAINGGSVTHWQSGAQPITKVEIGHPGFGDPYTVAKGFVIDAGTTRGDCGSILSVRDASIGPGKILGFHVAGDKNGKALSAAVSKELLEQVLPPNDCLMEPQIAEEQTFHGFPIVRELIRGPFIPPNTKIQRSVIYDWKGAVLTAPALLSRKIVDGVMIDPYVNALAKYSKPPPPLDEELVQNCAWSTYSYIMNSVLDPIMINRRVFSFEEAVLGKPGERFLDSIPRNTSAGYPYVMCKEKSGTGKTYWFGDDVDYDLDNPACLLLREEVSSIISMAADGVRSEHIFMDVLKDERRKIEKVKMGSTRMISGAPLAYLIAVRMYFLDFSAFLMSHVICTGSAVGINVYSEEWHLLSRFLLSKGNNMVAGDFKNFDGSESPIIHKAILEIINAWYDDGPTNAKIRETLWIEVYKSIHIHDRVVYQWSHSLPSGHPMTTIINTLYNLIVFRMAWCRLNPLRNRGVGEFEHHVYMVAYGDDNVVSVSDEAVKFFNQNTIPIAMSEFGMTYTTESKDVEAVAPDSRPLEAVTFLKRSFVKDGEDGVYIAPLDLDTVLEIACWTKRGKYSEEITIDNVNTVLKELSLHSKEIFDKYSSMLIEACRDKMSYYPPVVDQITLKAQMLATESIW